MQVEEDTPLTPTDAGTTVLPNLQVISSGESAGTGVSRGPQLHETTTAVPPEPCPSAG